MRRVARFARSLALLGILVAAACYSSSLTQPDGFENITSVVLRAWEDTRAGLPPLEITRPDSVALVVAFINSRRMNWEDAGPSLPGTPLFAELKRRTAIVGRFGFIETSHGAGGYFVMPTSSGNRLRPATAQELATFLAYFGISVELQSDRDP